MEVTERLRGPSAVGPAPIADLNAEPRGAAPAGPPLAFEVYGLRLAVETDHAGTLENLRRDFSHFRCEATDPDIVLILHLRPPPYAKLPARSATFVTPRNTCFIGPDTTYIDYHGRALARLDRTRNIEVFTTDDHLLHEIAYLYVLSTVGAHLDAMGIHRVHALGLEREGRGILLLLPSGGGKSTFGLKVLEEGGFHLLSEDTPLIDRSGRVLPFPLRIGLSPHGARSFPPEVVRTVRRMEFEPKLLVDVERFEGRIAGPVPVDLVLVGTRNLGEVSAIEPIGRLTAAKALLSHLVVGIGIYQGLEFLLERSPVELLGKMGLARSRLRSGLALLRRARFHRFVMGRDLDRNLRTFVDFVG